MSAKSVLKVRRPHAANRVPTTTWVQGRPGRRGLPKRSNEGPLGSPNSASGRMSHHARTLVMTSWWSMRRSLRCDEK